MFPALIFESCAYWSSLVTVALSEVNICLFLEVTWPRDNGVTRNRGGVFPGLIYQWCACYSSLVTLAPSERKIPSFWLDKTYNSFRRYSAPLPFIQSRANFYSKVRKLFQMRGDSYLKAEVDWVRKISVIYLWDYWTFVIS